MAWYLIRGGIGEYLVLVCILVRDIPLVSAGMERYHQQCYLVLDFSWAQKPNLLHI
jgi:hypothetical protein